MLRGVVILALQLLRIEWERQRDALFVPAPWLGRPDRTRGRGATR
jgi:hypothetical protein